MDISKCKKTMWVHKSLVILLFQQFMSAKIRIVIQGQIEMSKVDSKIGLNMMKVEENRAKQVTHPADSYRFIFLSAKFDKNMIRKKPCHESRGRSALKCTWPEKFVVFNANKIKREKRCSVSSTKLLTMVYYRLQFFLFQKGVGVLVCLRSYISAHSNLSGDELLVDEFLPESETTLAIRRMTASHRCHSLRW